MSSIEDTGGSTLVAGIAGLAGRCECVGFTRAGADAWSLRS